MSRTLRKQTLSMRGEPVDFAALAAANAQTRTLGNTRTNVRGDVLGDNGVVVKTQEQVQTEWARKQALHQQVKHNTHIKDNLNQTQFTTVQDLAGKVPAPNKAPRKATNSD